MDFKLIESKTLFKGKVFDLKVDTIEYNSSGNKGIREVAVHPGGAVVIPLTDEGKIIFVKQFRYPLQKWILELPAGKLDKDEDPAVCAERELTEETGFKAGSLLKLGKIYTTPGFCNEVLHIFLAKNLSPGEHNREEGEIGMQVIEFTLTEIDELIRTGKILDAKTICAIAMFKLQKAEL